MATPQIGRKFTAIVQSGADSINEVYFPTKPPSTGASTNVLANSWGPMDWMRIYSQTTGAVTLRLYVRGCPNWYDDSDFLDDYDEQYLAVEIPDANARRSVVTFAGEIWGWNFVDSINATVLLGTGSPPPA